MARHGWRLDAVSPGSVLAQSQRRRKINEKDGDTACSFPSERNLVAAKSVPARREPLLRGMRERSAAAGSPPHQQPVQALSGTHIREERAEALRHCRVSNNRIA